VAAALLAAHGALWAQSLSPEDKLAAIRKGLVQAALEGPTHVTTTQWIDGNGALQELSAFRSGMRVRGVRVLAYATDASGEPTAKLQWENADSAAPKPASQSAGASACKPAAKGGLQHVVGWDWTSKVSVDADSAPLLEALQSHMLAQLQLSGAQDALWRLVERPQKEGRSSYEQALLASSRDELPWLLKFELVGLGTKIPGEPAPRKPHADASDPETPVPPVTGLAVQLRMTLTARKQMQATLQTTAILDLRSSDDNRGPNSLNAAARDQVVQQAKAWGQALQQRLACTPVIADVTQAGGAQFRVNAGSAAGVRVGDEWVLAHDQAAVQGALNPAAAAQTVLAKVQSVGTFYAQLRPIAGDAQNVQTSWTAWSADALR